MIGNKEIGGAIVGGAIGLAGLTFMNFDLPGKLLGAAIGALAGGIVAANLSKPATPGTGGGYITSQPLSTVSGVTYGTGYGPRPDWTSAVHGSPGRMASLGSGVSFNR